MARLFYETTPTRTAPTAPRNSLMAHFGVQPSQLLTTPLQSADASQGSSNWSEKIVKLIPSEIIGGYLALIGLVPLVKLPSVQPWLPYAIFFFCLIFTPIYINSQALAGKPKRDHIILSTTSFIFWAYSISGAMLVPKLYDPALASIALIAFTVGSGWIRLDK